MKGEDISDRLVDFSVRIIRLVNALPKNMVGKHVSRQILRSGNHLAQITKKHVVLRVQPILFINSGLL
jgi:hypothetical protein